MSTTTTTTTTSTSSNALIEDQSTTTESFLISLYLNLALTVVFVIIFLIGRKFKPKLFSARTHDKPEYDIKPSPPPPSTSFFGWIPEFLSFNDGDIYNYSGLDSVIMIKIMKLGLKFCILSIPVAIGIILPLNVTGGNNLTGFDQMSMSNLSDSTEDNLRTIGHVIAMYYFTLLMIWLAHSQNVEYIQLRIKYLQEELPEAYSILVSGINPRDSSDEGLYALFNYMYPGKIHDAKIMRDIPNIEESEENRDGYLRKLESSLWEYGTSGPKGKRPKCGTKFFNLCGEKVDAIQYYRKKLNKHNEISRELREAPVEKTGNSGFVTFRDLKTATIAAQGLHDVNEYSLVVKNAPEPRDVYWPNISAGPLQKMVRGALVDTFTVALVFLWSIPIIAIQGLVSIENISKWFPELGDFLDANPGIKGLVSGFIPTIVIFIFMKILPTICYWLSILAGIEAYSWIQLSQVKRLFWFNFVNVFLVSTFAGAILNSIKQIIDNPSSILSILGEELPKVATFFINYIMILSFLGLFLDVSRIIPFFVGGIKKFFAKTPREKRDARTVDSLEYCQFYPDALLVFCLCFTYAVISPIIIIFGAVFFFNAWMVLKYECLYAYLQPFESGGKLWPVCFQYIVVGLVTSQLTLCGILILKESWIMAGCVVPILVITLVWYVAEDKLYNRPFTIMPITIATNTDEKRKNDTKEEMNFSSYLQPWFTSDLIFKPEQEVVDCYQRKLAEKGEVDDEDIESGAHSNTNSANVLSGMGSTEIKFGVISSDAMVKKDTKASIASTTATGTGDEKNEVEI